ncbi:MAG: DUF6263 family protein [Planctomycetota bacterium]|jgi:hypothetical protein
MRGRRFWIQILAVAVAVAPAVVRAESAEKMQYKLRLEKGKKYYVRTVTEQETSQILIVQEQRMQKTIGTGMDLEVNDVDVNGTMWINQTYAWVKFGQEGDMGEMAYDSSKKDSPVPRLMEGYAALLGEGFSLRMTPKGKVKAVRGLKRMRENISKKLPVGPLGEFLMKDLEQHISKEAIKELTENSMAMYPDKPVGVGDHWSKKVVLSQGFAMIINHKWTLKERKNGVAVIEVNSVVTPNRKAKPMEAGGAKISYEFSGRQWGSVQMQESTGLIAGSKINQDVSGRMQMETVDAGGKPQTMTVGLKIRGGTTTEMGEWRKDVWLHKKEEKD